MRVELQRGDSRWGWAYLRPLTGHDELALDAESGQAGNWLLRRLLDDRSDAALGPDGLDSLDMHNRDRLLAEIFRACFGENVDGISRCTHCGEEFEFHFTLGSLTGRRTEATAPMAEGPDAEGYYRLEGTRFRLPTVADLEAVGDLPADQAVTALLARCAEAGEDSEGGDAIQEAMEQLSPSLDLDIEASCPHCERAATISFSLEAFLMRALSQERRFLTIEIHRLATAYGWGLGEILGLSRDDRRTLARLAEHERIAAGRR
jgi:hypothetical protein